MHALWKDRIFTSSESQVVSCHELFPLVSEWEQFTIEATPMKLTFYQGGIDSNKLPE